MLRKLLTRTTVLSVVLMVLVTSTGGGDQIAPKQLISAPYHSDIVRWELTNFMNKWLHQLGSLIPGRSLNSIERQEAVRDYYYLNGQMRLFQQCNDDGLRQIHQDRVDTCIYQDQHDFDDLRRRWKSLQPVVEETLEATLTAVLEELGVINRIGPIRWPPVDFTFEVSPLLLITSPRDRIQRLDDITLRSDVAFAHFVELEGLVEEAEGVSAIVVPTSGVASYPAQISPGLSLNETLVLASHEWLHHYLFFRPLGRRWFAGGELRSINETVANIAGREIGDLAFAKLTGKEIKEYSHQKPSSQVRDELDEPGFDFNREMRITRLGLDFLLEHHPPEEAEHYLENRRQLFVRNGFPLRKLNTAYFAFYGTYGDNPASVSFIKPQLQAVRIDSGSVAEFLGRVSKITSAKQLENQALLSGWDKDSGL